MKTKTKKINTTLLYVALIATTFFWTAISVLAAEKESSQKNQVAEKSESKQTDTTQQNNDNEVDISDIQNQYWKAKDKDFEVVQNKLYTKTGRVEFGLLGGLYQRAEFQDTKTLGGSLAYHFSEILGLELMAYKMFSNDSSTLKRFKETRGATIEFNQEKYYAGLGVPFTPIYGKFSLFGKKISHFDLYLTPNIGITRTNANRFTYGLAIGQKFWIAPHWNIRLEYRWTHYTDRTNTSEGATAIKNGGPGYFEDSVNNQNLMLGVSYLF